MIEEYMWDDIPDDDPRAIAHAKKLWDELTPEEQAMIDRKVAETVARVMAERKKNKKGQTN